MTIKIPTGKYVLAVSGGVDSMVLLHILAKQSDIELVVAHFNHGIRLESTDDECFVAAAVKTLRLPFEVDYGRLGAGASEEFARKVRYEFLEQIKSKYKAKAVITAHHQDDLIETAFINLLRGTGRKGLVAISSNKKILRPLLGWSKAEILTYGAENKLTWRDDESNNNTDYLRNYIRRNLMSKLNDQQRTEMVANLDKVAEIDTAIENLSEVMGKTIYTGQSIDRASFTKIPVAVAGELLARWLRQQGVSDFDKPTIDRLNTAIRTAKPLTSHPVKRGIYIKISKKSASLHPTP